MLLFSCIINHNIIQPLGSADFQNITYLRVFYKYQLGTGNKYNEKLQNL